MNKGTKKRKPITKKPDAAKTGLPATEKPVHPFKLMRPDHVIVPSFVVNGVQHYTLYDTFNTASHRMMAAIHVLDEWQNRTTHDVLRLFVTAMKQAVNSKEGVKVTEVSDLLNKLQERLDWPVPTRDIMINMASALHFDESESPYDYDEKYNKEIKIPSWKLANVDNFFLYEHLRTPLGLPIISQPDLLGAMLVIGKMDELHLKKSNRVSQDVS